MIVEIYTPPTVCMSCRYVKRWLTKRGIPFEEKEMTDEVRDEFFDGGYREFPIVVYGGRSFSGMREVNLKQLEADYRYFEGAAQ